MNLIIIMQLLSVLSSLCNNLINSTAIQMHTAASINQGTLTFRSFHFKNVSSVTLVRFCDVRAALWNQQQDNTEHSQHQLDLLIYSYNINLIHNRSQNVDKITCRSIRSSSDICSSSDSFFWSFFSTNPSHNISNSLTAFQRTILSS